MNNKITIHDGKLKVPDHVTIPFIEGDGIGMDISKPAQNIVDAAVETSYDNQRAINWKEVWAGEKAFKETGEWLPDETIFAGKPVKAIRSFSYCNYEFKRITNTYRYGIY